MARHKEIKELHEAAQTLPATPPLAGSPAMRSSLTEIVDVGEPGFLVTSVFLDVDPEKFPAPEHLRKSLDSTIDQSGEELEALRATLSRETYISLQDDLSVVRDYVTHTYDRGHALGLSMFSLSASKFWHVEETPETVPNRVVFAPHPYLTPLVKVISLAKPLLILLTDREFARVFLMDGLDVTEVTKSKDFVPHRSEQGGLSQARYQRHSDEWAKHHLSKAARIVFELEQHEPFRWIVLGVEPEIEQDVDRDLHPYIKDKVVAKIHVRLDAPVDEIAERAGEARARAEERLIDRLVERVREGLGPSGHAAAGLPDTIEALNEKRVHILLFQDGFSHPGTECPNCGLLVPEQVDICPACEHQTRRVDNVVDAAVQRAIEQRAQVEAGQLDSIDSIGALLYY
jgi:hypothetical protein